MSCKNAKRIDIIGPEFMLENEGSQRFQTCQGAIVSVAVGMLVVALAFLFGKEIYERKLPNVTVSQEIVEQSRIFLNGFPLMISIQDINGNRIENIDKYFDTTVFKIVMNDLGKVYQDNIDFYKLEKCDYNKFVEHGDLVKDYVEKYSSNDFLCINFNEETYFQNEYFSLNSTNINIGIRKCVENKITGKSCASEKELENIGSQAIVGTTYLTTFMDFTVYAKPIYSYLDHFKTGLSDELLKRTYLRFTRNIFVSDIGWLIEDKRVTEYLSLQSIVPDDMRYIKLDPNFKDMLYILSLESPKTRQRVFRNYMKFQILLSNIGGLVNALVIGSRMLMYPYLRYIYLFLIKEIALSELGEEFDSASSFSKLAHEARLSNSQSRISRNNSNILNNNGLPESSIDNSKNLMILDRKSKAHLLDSGVNLTNNKNSALIATREKGNTTDKDNQTSISKFKPGTGTGTGDNNTQFNKSTRVDNQKTIKDDFLKLDKNNLNTQFNSTIKNNNVENRGPLTDSNDAKNRSRLELTKQKLDYQPGTSNSPNSKKILSDDCGMIPENQIRDANANSIPFPQVLDQLDNPKEEFDQGVLMQYLTIHNANSNKEKALIDQLRKEMNKTRKSNSKSKNSKSITSKLGKQTIYSKKISQSYDLSGDPSDIDNVSSYLQIKTLKKDFHMNYCRYVCDSCCNRSKYNRQQTYLRAIGNLLSIKQITSFTMNYHMSTAYKEKTLKIDA